ncbi:MAG: aldo/keto reductase [Candidatus Aminicenantes bacterium]|nr:aldo/keto reductase [Candidatus Aminicenantes bacterium]
MQKRALGKTGLQVSVLGFGGFHLVEIVSAEAARLLGAYLDQGGNYIETAAGYGNGISEAKIGKAISHRRTEYVLATKSAERTRQGLLRELDRSLCNLKTDHVDVMFVHAVQTLEDVDQVLAPGGALEGAMEARQAGKLRFLAISGHGRPDALLAAVKRRDFDVLMTGFNYYDRFNFPAVEGELLPLCRQRGVGVIAMKSLADGYLYKSPEPALRYALSLPVATVAAGINSAAMLETDLGIVSRFTPMSEAEKEELYRTAPELGSYICRLCGKCRTADFDPQKVFLLEGVFDRQMDDMRVTDTARYALQERLKHWLAQTELAKTEYEALAGKVDASKDYGALSALCPYGIDVDRKLKIAHGKLSREPYLA